MTKLLKTITLISLAALSSCVTMESAKPAMDAMKGKPISAAIDKLGYPDGQMNIAGKKVYVWNTNSTESYLVPDNTTTTTWVNGSPVHATSYGTRSESFELQCKLKVIASEADVIEKWEWEGNVGGCEVYAMRLQKKS